MRGNAVKKARLGPSAGPTADRILNGVAITLAIIVCLSPLAIIGGSLLGERAREARRQEAARAALAPIEELGGAACMVSFNDVCDHVFDDGFYSFDDLFDDLFDALFDDGFDLDICFVTFADTARLDDTTMSKLSSLNALPEGSFVHLTIESRNVTDASLESLKTLRGVGWLDVTDTAISDNGLRALASAFPGCDVKLRRRAIRTRQIHPQTRYRRSGRR
jgi:hypothetical protein